MTGQIADKVVFRGTTYDLAGYSGGPLFDPIESGLRPTAIHTACWRGFIATYAITDGRFVLHDLEVNDGEQAFPPINGVAAEPGEHMARTYRAIELPIPYSGTLHLGADFDSSLYTHMGFQPAWKYRTVWAVTCQDGAVTEEQDLSAEMRERAQHPEDLRPHRTEDHDVVAWIDSTFDRRIPPEPPT